MAKRSFPSSRELLDVLEQAAKKYENSHVLTYSSAAKTMLEAAYIQENGQYFDSNRAINAVNDLLKILGRPTIR